MQTLVDAAVEYLAAGLPIIALSGKLPNTDFHPKGVHSPISGTVETDDDRRQLAEVFTHPKTTGIGLPIWPHACVIDIDGEDGARQWRDIAGGEYLPETPIARTGRGLHLWFATPHVLGNAKLGPKLDLKGVGGYVAAPPSRHPDGHRYEWLVPMGPMEWLPDSVEKLIADRQRDDDLFHVERPVYTLYNLSLQRGAWRLHTELIPPPIDGLIRSVRDAPEGNRNNILAWAALQARDEGVTLEGALRDLGAAATDAGLEPAEIRTTIKSAYRRSRPPLG